MHHSAAGRLGDLLPHPGAGAREWTTRRAQDWGASAGGRAPAGARNPVGGLLESHISLPPPPETGSPTQGWGHCPPQAPGARFAFPGPLPLAYTLRSSLAAPRLGAQGSCLLGHSNPSVPYPVGIYEF